MAANAIEETKTAKQQTIPDSTPNPKGGKPENFISKILNASCLEVWKILNSEHGRFYKGLFHRENFKYYKIFQG